MVARLQSGPLLHVQNFNGCETKTTGTGAALYTKAHCALRCTMLACNHTDCVHIRLLSRIFSLAYFVPHLLTPAQQQQQGALSALCLIPGHLCWSLCNHVLVGTWHHITEIQQKWTVEPQPAITFEGLLLSSLTLFSSFSHSPLLSIFSTSLSTHLHMHIQQLPCSICSVQFKP